MITNVAIETTKPRRVRGLRSLVVVPMVTIAVAAATLVAAAPASAHQPSGVCASNVFIGVRGTNAPAGSVPSTTGNAWQVGGMGDQIAGLAAHFANDSPYNGDWPTYVESLNYPAAPEQLNSSQEGANTLRAELNYLGSLCGVRAPNILLAGHSQGAMVIDMVLAHPEMLNARAREAVKAVVLFGDPGHRPNMPYSRLNTTRSGLLPLTTSEVNTIAQNFRYWGWEPGSSNPDPAWVSKVRDYCYSQDAVCTNNLNDNGWYTHTIYPTKHSEVAAWMDARLTDFS